MPRVELAADEEIVEVVAGVAPLGEEVLPGAEGAKIQVEGEAVAEEDSAGQELLREAAGGGGGRRGMMVLGSQ